MKYILNTELGGNLITINDSLFEELKTKLSNIKGLIDEYPREWDKIKRCIHEYEYIYTSSYYKKNVSRVSPISRSYFKLCELFKDHNILKKDSKNNKFVCLAEAPGGFIQALLNLVDYRDIDKIHAITLISDDIKIPSWNRSLKNNNIIKFHTGVNGDGNLYDLLNVLSFIKDIGRGTADLITGDGGFDYSNDYSKQEENSLKLIYSEIFIALNIQKKGGTFICKVFDIFMKETIMLLYILKNNYNQIIIHKPCVSRMTNSEKYIICIGFKGYNRDQINKLCHNFEDNKLDFPIYESFIKDIMLFNNNYCDIQGDHIMEGIRLIKDNKIQNGPTRNHIKKAKDWCNRYDIPINLNCYYL